MAFLDGLGGLNVLFISVFKVIQSLNIKDIGSFSKKKKDTGLSLFIVDKLALVMTHVSIAHCEFWKVQYSG